MDGIKRQVRLIELDAILDTRIPILKEMGLDVQRILDSGYRNRMLDLPGIDYDKYMVLYKNRSVKYLKGAKVTELLFYIQDEGKDERIMTESGMDVRIREVWVNINPYKLDIKERHVIGESVNALLEGGGFRLKVVDIPIEELTPEFFEKNDITDYYIYQHELWVNQHVKGMVENKRYMNTTIHTPYLISAELDEEKALMLDRILSTGHSPHEAMAFYYSTLFPIDFMKSRVFTSVLAPDVYPDYIDTGIPATFEED